MSAFLNDIRYSLRMSAKYPGTTAVAVISLALAIGPNTTLFSVVDHLFLRPPPIQGLSEVYQLSTPTAKGISEAASYPDFLDYQAAVGGSVPLTALLCGHGVLLTVNGATQAVPVCQVSENFFSTFGVRPAAGRALAESDKQYSEAPPVMISYRLWQRTFEGDAALPGKSVMLNGSAFRVVGVLPRDFRPPGTQVLPPDVWMPFSVAKASFRTDLLAGREVRELDIWTRLRNREDKPRVEAALNAVAVRLAHDFPRTNHAIRARLRSEFDTELGAREASLIVLSLVGLVLLIACANIAGVLLAQGEARRREFAVRLAMGARAGRIVRQLLTESLLLGVAAAALGALMAAWLVDALPSLLPPLPLTMDFDFRIDARVLAYTLLVSFAAAIACGLFPALRVARRDLVESLKGDAPRGRFHWWFRGALLVGQIAVAQFLLAGAALLTHSYLEQMQIHPGFDTARNLAIADVVSLGDGGTDFGALRDKLRTLPGVRQATFAMRLPLGASGGGAARMVFVPGVTPEPVSVGYADVGPGYFSLMGTRLLRGREFFDHESGRPAVINESMARRFWGGGDAAMGRFLRVDNQDYQVTGVVEDGKYSDILEGPRPYFFVPARTKRGEGVLAVETAGDPAGVLPAMRQALLEADPNVNVISLTTMLQHLRIAYFTAQISALMMGSIALLGVFLAGVGLYGVISYSVNRRAHEIGLRMSLGARPRDVLILVLRQAAWLVAAGSTLGLAAAFLGARVASGLLYQVSPADPAAIVASLLTITALTFAAAHFPARRAVRLDPMTVLRRE
jgi:putative ABC transport system permease protein